MDAELRAVPVRASAVSEQQYAELVEAIGDVFAQQARALLELEVVAHHFMQTEHSVVAWMVCVIASGPIHDLAVLAHREVIRYRMRLAVRNQPSLIRPL